MTGVYFMLVVAHMSKARPAISAMFYVDNSPDLTKWPLETRNSEKSVEFEAIFKFYWKK